MDEDLSIINTNTRNEKIKNFFVNNKNKIISGIIILIIILAGVFSYDKYLINKKKDISDSYNTIIIEYSDSNKEETANKLIEIIDKKGRMFTSDLSRPPFGNCVEPENSILNIKILN